jgi:hypothetical protein
MLTNFSYRYSCEGDNNTVSNVLKSKGSIRSIIQRGKNFWAILLGNYQRQSRSITVAYRMDKVDQMVEFEPTTSAQLS